MVGALGIRKKKILGDSCEDVSPPKHRSHASGGMPFSFLCLCYLHHRIIEVAVFFSFLFPKLRSGPREEDNHRLHDPGGLP